MPDFKVTISEMRAKANEIKQAADTFLQAAGQVNAAAQELAGTWDGDSQVAFVEEQEKANTWYNKMMEIVNTYVTGLETTAKNYEEADNQATQAIRSK